MDGKDFHGNTALHLAVMLGRDKCTQLLLAHGAQVRIIVVFYVDFCVLMYSDEIQPYGAKEYFMGMSFISADIK